MKGKWQSGGHGRLCFASVHAVMSVQPCRQVSRWSWCHTRASMTQSPPQAGHCGVFRLDQLSAAVAVRSHSRQ